MAGTVKLEILDRLRIASPCPMRWDDMQGDDRKRFFGECRLHVYNLSAMSGKPSGRRRTRWCST